MKKDIKDQMATVSGKLKLGKGLEMVDEDTGEIWCLRMKSGETIKTQGECQ